MGLLLEDVPAAAGLGVPATRAALAFEDVTKRFGRVVALDRASWTVEIGARACLLGPNGAGKSTSIRLLQGALAPTTGQVSLLGADVSRGDYLDARRRTGIVPQGPWLRSGSWASSMSSSCSGCCFRPWCARL